MTVDIETHVRTFTRAEQAWTLTALMIVFLLGAGDATIVTTAMPRIVAQLGGLDLYAWVTTAYLLTSTVMVPIWGKLSDLHGRKRVLIVAVAIFLAGSCLSGLSGEFGPVPILGGGMTQLIVFRALQGFLGGSMIPTVFTTALVFFQGKQRVIAASVVGGLASLAPTLGPVIGGWITDTWSWHWLFYINLVPGILVTILVPLLVRVDKPDWGLLKQADYLGIVLMSLFLGCLEYVLEEGPRWDWLADNTIFTAAVVSAIAAVFFFWRVLVVREPIVELRTFVNRNFALGAFYTFVIGTGLYGATYLIPLFLAQVRGFSAFQIGETVVVTGVAQMLMSPFTAQIARRLDLRVMLAIGMALFSVAIYLTASLTNQSGFWELLFPQALRGFALMFCYLPANMISLGSLPPDKLKSGASLYNLTRDLGGAIVLATIGTIMNTRLHFHWSRLIENINPARPAVQHFLDAETARLGPHFTGDATPGAIKLLGGIVQREALVLTFNDVILLLGTMFVIGLILMPLVRRPRSQMAG